ncbi:hypothetical protein, partial [Candidatus Magnetobacterium casense]|uniref:hypothetical protein n=1 Tax=Candidatus Magnetobacterium casense TaxID=1455061 RepID=UPI001C48A9B1
MLCDQFLEAFLSKWKALFSADLVTDAIGHHVKGHGVPGAIMTMLAGSTLSRVVNELGYTDPSAILNNM